jgi:hypothetical protein
LKDFRRIATPVTSEDLVSEQMMKGCNYEVAAQRVMQLHGSAAVRHRAIIDDIEDQCHKRAEDIWYDDPELSRTEALRKARLANPRLFAALQRS